MSYFSTRRQFLTATSIAATGALTGARALEAFPALTLPARSPLAPNAALPDPLVPSLLQRLATTAVDAARSAGAQYADVRVAELHELSPGELGVGLTDEIGYGVRAQVNGAWGFAYGRALGIDAVAQCARQAVSAARASAKLMPERARATLIAWTEPAAVTGEWRSPMEIDPFTVPIQEHTELDGSIAWHVGRVPGADGGVRGSWKRQTWVFAATNGSLTTQRLCLASKWASVNVQYGRSRMSAMVSGFGPKLVGYEYLLTPDIADRCVVLGEELAELSRLPMREIDVGRYPMILDGAMMGSLLSTIVGPSAELDRVLGYEIDASGGSRWSLDLLGTPIASSLLTVSAHRKVPYANAVRWDAEGVVPREYTMISDGRLVNYHTSAQTVATLESWYGTRGEPLQPTGSMATAAPDRAPNIRPPHLVMKSSLSPMSFDDLMRDTGNGIAVLHNGHIKTDQQLSSGTIDSSGILFEVSRGKIVRRLKDMALQFNMLSLLKDLVAVGDESTIRERFGGTSKGMPWHFIQHGTTAPAARFKAVNVISTERA
jgi:TldD protein